MEAELAVIFGINAILEKLRASPVEIVEIVTTGNAARIIEREAERMGVRARRASPQELDRLASGERHQGAVARVTAFAYSTFTEFMDTAALPARAQRILMLDGVTDPRNLGALIRAADGAGVSHVVIPKDRSAGVTPTVIKASAGAAYHVKIYQVTNLRRAMQQLKDSGYWLVGLDAGVKSSIYDKTYPERLGIVLGSEGQGIRPLVHKECDFHVSIPMVGKVASLNVSVAGAVFLYEVLRQHGKIDKGKT